MMGDGVDWRCEISKSSGFTDVPFSTDCRIFGGVNYWKGGDVRIAVVYSILQMAVVMAVVSFMVCITFDVFYTNSYVVFVLYTLCYLYHVFYVHDNLLVKL
jgi:hypothetical protein